MNKKISRLLQPGMRLYFIIIVIFALTTFLLNMQVAIGQCVVIVILYIYSKVTMSRQRSTLLDYIEEVTYSVESVKKDNMINFPVPMVIFRLDNGEIIWSNESFTEMTGEREHLFEHSLTDAIPNFSTKWLMEGKTQCPELVEVGGRKYQVYGNIVRTESETQDFRFLGNAYWMDVTDYANIRTEFYNTRPVCSLIVLDNYDELFKNLTEKEKSALLANIDDKISQWCEPSHGFLCKYDRDRYVHIFEEQYLEGYIAAKFSLLDSVREITNSVGIPATISIGVGKDSGTFIENFEYAKLGIEMALSRGGDQAVVKNRYNFEFYGGRSSEQEKRTKVKSRVTANSLDKLIAGSSKVFIMGHRHADFDSLGTACGVCCIARKRGVETKIVIDREKNAVGPMLERLLAVPEYEHTFINAQQALLELDSASLLVVVDTNRPDQVESLELLESVGTVVVIDHHRRAADYIQNAAINFHEPYASSACELVAELLQYTVDQADILRVEAEAVMAGMVMDTKNFTLRTGSRTFEAAAFLRRTGASTTEVKRMMQNDFTGTVARYNVIRQAEQYREGIVIAAPETEENRVVAAQAADELLNIAGIQASFVLFPTETGITISARSIGEVNVQLIVEKLGGGGNKSTAGAQLRDKSHSEALAELKAAIDAYFADESQEELPHKQEGKAE